MKNALFLLSIWVGIILAAYAMVYWDPGVEPPTVTEALQLPDAVYVDGDGRFSFSYPPTWTLVAQDGTVTLSDLHRDVEVTIYATDEPIPETVLLDALGLAGADRGTPPFEVEEAPVAGASERAVRIAPTDGSGYGLGYLYEGGTVVFLVRGDSEAVEDRAAALARIESGFAVPAEEEEEETPAESTAPVVEL